MGADRDRRIGERARDIVLRGIADVEPAGKFAGKALWGHVRRCGSELWLDTGDIAEASALWSPEFTAVTTNNTLLNREIQKGTYDGLIERVAAEIGDLVPEEDMPLELAFVLNAYHGLKISRMLDASVSVELHTDLADDVERSVAYGRRYHAIAPERFYIKVPLTPAGLLAARRLSQDGVPVNFTLGFSARQNYLAAAFARTAFVNVFLGRLNSFVADNGLGDGALVGEKATLSSQRGILELRNEMGVPTRQIAASVRGGEQVLTLAGVDVFTLPTKVARKFEDMSPPAGSIRRNTDAALEVELAEGVDRESLGIDALCDLTAAFKAAVRELVKSQTDGMSPDGLREFWEGRGFGDLLPGWSAADVDVVTRDGKIPRYERWRGRLAGREIGLDSLMNVSGLRSFTSDQAAMDERVRSML